MTAAECRANLKRQMSDVKVDVVEFRKLCGQGEGRFGAVVPARSSGLPTPDAGGAVRSTVGMRPLSKPYGGR